MYTRTILSSISDSDSVNDVPSSWVTLSKLELECDPGPCLHQLVAAGGEGTVGGKQKRRDGSDPGRLGYFVSQFLWISHHPCQVTYVMPKYLGSWQFGMGGRQKGIWPAPDCVQSLVITCS